VISNIIFSLIKVELLSSSSSSSSCVCIYIYIYIYMCVCVCVRARARARLLACYCLVYFSVFCEQKCFINLDLTIHDFRGRMIW